MVARRKRMQWIGLTPEVCQGQLVCIFTWTTWRLSKLARLEYFWKDSDACQEEKWTILLFCQERRVSCETSPRGSITYIMKWCSAGIPSNRGGVFCHFTVHPFLAPDHRIAAWGGGKRKRFSEQIKNRKEWLFLLLVSMSPN